VCLDCGEGGAEGVAEAFDWFDDVVGCEEGDDGVGGLVAHEGAGKGDCREGVAAFGLADVVADGGDCGADGCFVAGAAADPAVFGGDDAFEAVEGSFHEALTVEDGDELFGHGFARQRPEADAGAAGEDDGVVR